MRAQEEVHVEDEYIATRQVFNQLDVEKASREEKSKADKLKAGQKEPPPGAAMQEEQPVRPFPPFPPPLPLHLCCQYSVRLRVQGRVLPL